jgi:hypothetical protein
MFLLNEKYTLVCPEMGEIRFGSPGNRGTSNIPPSSHCEKETPPSYVPSFCYTFSDKDAYNEPIIFISSDPLFS